MKIVLAPNALKGSLSATHAAQAMERGLRAAWPTAEVVRVPVADGGDGLVEVLIEALGGEALPLTVSGPLGEPVQASLCHVPSRHLAVIEMASASGLTLLAPERCDPTRTSTFGTGELIRAALDLGVQRIIVGIGGSATNDGGIGMAAALGVGFLDADGREVTPVGGALGQIWRVDTSGLDPRLQRVCCDVLCDVDNPLTGPRGAAAVYGPQKGATPEQVAALDAGLSHLAERLRADLGLDVSDLPGAGAAGGLGACLHAFLGAKLRRGVDLVLDLVGLEQALDGADLVITAEGRIDGQTAHGKAPAGVAERAKARNIPCIAIAGSIGEGAAALHALGIDALFSLCPAPMTLKQAMSQGSALLEAATEQVVRCFFSRQGV